MKEMRWLWFLCVAVMILPLQPRAALAQHRHHSEPVEPTYVSPPAWKCVEVGNFYFKQKKYAGALSRYQEAVRVDSDYAPAYLGLGKVYEKIGLKEKALKAYKQYLDELPSTKQADEAKDVHEAIARLEKEIGSGKSKASTHP